MIQFLAIMTKLPRLHTSCLAPVGVGLFALVVYALTTAPDLTWAHHGADGGDLVTAAYTLGVPHPSGYPLYTLLGWLATRLPLGSVAYQLHLFSALCASMAAGLVTAMMQGLLSRYFPDLPRLWRAIIAGVSGASLAFAPLYWSQAIIAEVYALNAYLVALALLLAWRWGGSTSGRFTFALGLVCGLGMSNHLTFAFALPAVAILLAMAGARWRAFAVAAAGGLLGLLPYVYLPLAALADPYVNWGDPSGWRGFVWLASGALYRGYPFALPLSHLPVRLATWAGELARQFGPWGAALGLLGAWRGAEDRRWGWASGATFALYSLYAIGYNTADSLVYLIPAHMIWALWAALGAATVIEWARDQPKCGERGARVVLALICLLPLASLAWNWSAMDISRDSEAVDFASGALVGLPEGAILISASDGHTFSLWYMQQVRGVRPDVLVLDRDLAPYDWYWRGLERRYSDLSWLAVWSASWLEGFVEANLDRGVYLADEDPGLMERYEARPAGALWELGSR
jgi:hypothetical protein